MFDMRFRGGVKVGSGVGGGVVSVFCLEFVALLRVVGRGEESAVVGICVR